MNLKNWPINTRKVAFLAGLMLFCLPVKAQVTFSGLNDISLGSWSGTGGLHGSDSYCIVSKNNNWWGASRVRYDVAAYGPADSAGNFRLSSTTNNATLPINFRWTGNRGSYLMSNYSNTGYTTPYQNGALNCSEAAADAQIDIEVSAANLASAAAGTYTGTFRIDSLQLSSPRSYNIQTFTVTIPELIQISDLDDIDLGSQSGTNDAVGSDGLCIFRNGGGSYTLRASGGTGNNDPYELSNGTSTLPYTVAFREGSSPFVNQAPGTSSSSLSGSSIQNCGGTNNADVRVKISAADITAADPGNYNGVLYITAEPL